VKRIEEVHLQAHFDIADAARHRRRERLGVDAECESVEDSLHVGGGDGALRADPAPCR